MSGGAPSGYKDLSCRGIRSLERAAKWLDGMRWPGASSRNAGITRSSDWHDVERWPDMLLPATYNSVIARILIGEHYNIPDEEKRGVGDFLTRFQGDDGRFGMPSMNAGSVYKHPEIGRTWEYIGLHISNYARQALAWCSPANLKEPVFVEEIIPNDEQADSAVAKWITARYWRDPWMEGNVIVNVAGLLLERSQRRRVDEMIEELNKIQDPTTGFWGVDQARTRRALLHAFAGGMHSFHLYYHNGVTVPNAAAAIDVALDLGEHELDGLTSACLDVDLVEMLASLWPVNHRRNDIRGLIARKVKVILSAQNPDGGFYDEAEGIRRFDGWVGGYWEPQGLSNCFATWFRSLTVAIGLSVIDPQTIENWTFRDRIGIGYFDPQRLRGI